MQSATGGTMISTTSSADVATAAAFSSVGAAAGTMVKGNKVKTVKKSMKKTPLSKKGKKMKKAGGASKKPASSVVLTKQGDAQAKTAPAASKKPSQDESVSQTNGGVAAQLDGEGTPAPTTKSRNAKQRARKKSSKNKVLNWKPVSLPNEFRATWDESGKVNYGEMFGVTVEELDAGDYEIFGLDKKTQTSTTSGIQAGDITAAGKNKKTTTKVMKKKGAAGPATNKNSAVVTTSSTCSSDVISAAEPAAATKAENEKHKNLKRARTDHSEPGGAGASLGGSKKSTSALSTGDEDQHVRAEEKVAAELSDRDAPRSASQLKKGKENSTKSKRSEKKEQQTSAAPVKRIAEVAKCTSNKQESQQIKGDKSSSPTTSTKSKGRGDETSTATSCPPESEIAKIEKNWNPDNSLPFPLHPALLQGLAHKKFYRPSAIQQACLVPALAGKDIVGVAETGSGKTLAFGLPVLQKCLEMKETKNHGTTSGSRSNKDELGGRLQDLQVGEETTTTATTAASSSTCCPAREQSSNSPLVGLIIVPTRELAQQVKKHLDDVVQKFAALPGSAVLPASTSSQHHEYKQQVFTVCLVGGLTPIKQLRLLEKQPQIIVGTPGRIAQLAGLVTVSKKNTNEDAISEQSQWLVENFKQVQFLILDEADRLVEQGHFRDLTKILDFLYKEKKVDFILNHSDAAGKNDAKRQKKEDDTINPNDIELGARRKAEKLPRLQTLVFSATLADVEPLMEKVRFCAGASNASKMNKPVVIDLSQQKTRLLAAASAATITKSGSVFPEKLRFERLSFTKDEDRDCLLCYYVLQQIAMLQQNSRSGAPADVRGAAPRTSASNSEDATTPASVTTPKMIVFTNAISMVYRLYSLFGLLLGSDAGKSKLAAIVPQKGSTRRNNGLHGGKKNFYAGNSKRSANEYPLNCDVFALHSNMSQKERLNKMDKFRNSGVVLDLHGVSSSRTCEVEDGKEQQQMQSPPKDAAILICTDLAARGLDVPDVNYVVHYQAPRSSEIFIHRTGRTARAGKAGTALIMRAPGDVQKYDELVAQKNLFGEKGDELILELAVPQAKKLQSLRQLLENCSNLEKQLHEVSKKHKEKEWFKRHSKECELDFSDLSDSEDGDFGGGHDGDFGGVKKENKEKLAQLYNQVKQKLQSVLKLG
ncbi:unnamed protein product [Amoebophrya sp. A120]|nr:unnamed protein product [Amoebophrya sp. A120]|eukprot:GSA120T00008711001.1